MIAFDNRMFARDYSGIDKLIILTANRRVNRLSGLLSHMFHGLNVTLLQSFDSISIPIHVYLVDEYEQVIELSLQTGRVWRLRLVKYGNAIFLFVFGNYFQRL